MVAIQPSATFLPTGSSQLETDNDGNLFNTTFGDHHSFHRSASVDTVMTDHRVDNTGEALMERCSAFDNATLPVSINSSEGPNTPPITCDQITASNNNIDDIAETRDTAMPHGYLFQADPADDVRSCSTYYSCISPCRIPSNAQNGQTSGQSMIIQAHNVDVLTSVTAFSSSMCRDETMDVSVAHDLDGQAGASMSVSNPSILPSTHLRS
jgi:hypothetical protein